MMKSLIFIFLLLAFYNREINSQQCDSHCKTCTESNNPYSCLSCYPNNQFIYIFSCPIPSRQIVPFLTIGVIITAMHIFLLFMSVGVYRDIFERIQLVTLITWRYGFEKGAVAMQITNLAIVKYNTFHNIFGIQFCIAMGCIFVFWMIVLNVQKFRKRSIRILIKRKKIIVPTRIITFIFNITLYASLVQITTSQTQSISKTAFIIATFFAIFAFIKLTLFMIGLLVACNTPKKCNLSDPRYYVLIQEVKGRSWYKRNHILLSLVNRAAIILVFVLMFKQALIASIIITALQVSYSLFLILFMRFEHFRYHFFIILANIQIIAILVTILMSQYQAIDSPQWQAFSQSYQINLLILCAIFFIASLIQLIIRRRIILKQLQYYFRKCCACNQEENQKLFSKPNENPQVQDVIQFHQNPLYNQKLKEIKIQLSVYPTVETKQ